MNPVIVANLLGTIGSIVIIITGLFKKKEHILGGQILQFILMGSANFFLKGYASVVSNALSLLRNVYAFKFPFSTIPKLIFIILLGYLSLSVNTLGLLGVIPFVTTAAFTWFMDKDAKTIKYVTIITMIMWAYYDFSVRNYATSLFDSLTVISNIYGITRINKDLKENT